MHTFCFLILSLCLITLTFHPMTISKHSHFTHFKCFFFFLALAKPHFFPLELRRLVSSRGNLFVGAEVASSCAVNCYAGVGGVSLAAVGMIDSLKHSAAAVASLCRSHSLLIYREENCLIKVVWTVSVSSSGGHAGFSYTLANEYKLTKCYTDTSKCRNIQLLVPIADICAVGNKLFLFFVIKKFHPLQNFRFNSSLLTR